MGQKGAKLTQLAELASKDLVKNLSATDDVHSKKMFGGYGIFAGGAMFALINSEGKIFFKADDSNRQRFIDAGTEKHARMPYFEVPQNVLSDHQKLDKWAKESMEIAQKSAIKK